MNKKPQLFQGKKYTSTYKWTHTKKEPNYKLNYSNNKISLLFAETNETISTQWFNIIKMKFTQTIKRTWRSLLAKLSHGLHVTSNFHHHDVHFNTNSECTPMSLRPRTKCSLDVECRCTKRTDKDQSIRNYSLLGNKLA